MPHDDSSSTADVHFGVGLSDEGGPEAAAAAACLAAQRAIAPAQARGLLICDNFEGEHAAVLTGACSVADASIVHGAVTFSQFSHDGAPADKSVGALAIGGNDVQVTAQAVADIRDREEASGVELGKRLAPAVENAQGSKVLILIGDCHVPRNEQLLQGVQDVLGDTLPIVGCSAKLAPDVCVYHAGELVEGGTIGVLVSGKFRLGLASASVGWRKGTSQQIASSAGAGVTAVMDDLQATPDLILGFNCGGRRGLLLKDDPTRVAGELDEIRRVLPEGVPLLTMYGSGEMGHVHRDEAATAVGFHIMLCAIAAASTDPREHTA